MTNVIDWLRESAAYMAKDRPDVYDHATAVEELSEAIDYMRDDGRPFACTMFTSYVLTRLEDEGVEEFILSRKLSHLNLFDDEEEVLVYRLHPDIDLPDPLDDDIDL
jgi:nitric oxide reductase activation protein